MSNEFMRHYRQLKKKKPDTPLEDLKKDLYSILDRSLPPMPEALVEEAFQYFIVPVQTEDELEKAADLVDFFHDTLEVEKSVLEEVDWLFIRDLVNMFALDLDLDFISYVMEVMVSQGWIHKT